MSFSFGTPSSAPATGMTGGFNFGANKPATPGFGLAATSQPSSGLFGTPATSAPAFGTSFGNTSFGANPAPTFGANNTTPAFGANTTTPAFGATTSAPSFGTTPASGLTGFGATSTPSFGLGSGLNFGTGTNTSAPSTGLSFGAPASTAPSLGGFSFSTAQTTAGFGLLGSSTATTTNSLFGAKLGSTTVTGTLPSTSVTSIGLGGVSNLTSGIGTTGTDAKTDPPKQQKLPNEILTTVDNFKNFVKKQKSLSSEVMRVSVKPLHTVSRQAEETLREALSLQSGCVRARAAARQQRQAAVTAIAAAEAAARDHAHPGYELEDSAPPAFIKEVISDLELKLIAFRAHMDSADKQMQSSPKVLTAQELSQGFRYMYEALVALAARMQGAHSSVEAQKEQYLNLRKYILKDPTDVFDNPTPSSTLDQILKDLDGRGKNIKSNFGIDSSAVVSDPKVALNSTNLAGPSPFAYMGGASPFPLADNSAAWQPQATPVVNPSANTSFGGNVSDSGFQLQKPPGKRGKQ